VNQSFEIEMADAVGNVVAPGFSEKRNYGSQPGYFTLILCLDRIKERLQIQFLFLFSCQFHNMVNLILSFKCEK
jgi:hypothetical protein